MTERVPSTGMRVFRFSPILLCSAAQAVDDSPEFFMQREIEQLKSQFPDLENFEPFLERENRQWNQRRPQMSNETLDELMQLYVDSVQEMRDASFGPLATGRAEIKRLVNAVEDFSLGSALFEKGQNYLKVVDALRHSYMYVPRDYSDVFTSLKDFEMFLKRAKDDILDELQNFIQFAEDAPWTARQTCQGTFILFYNPFLNLF